MNIKEFWKNRSYWQKGAIVGVIYGFLQSLYYIVPFLIYRWSPIASIVILIVISVFCISFGVLFGFAGFLIGLFFKRKQTNQKINVKISKQDKKLKKKGEKFSWKER